MNPWKKILLSDYENHMSLESVAQLQALNRIMKEQFCIYEMLRKKIFRQMKPGNREEAAF